MSNQRIQGWKRNDISVFQSTYRGAISSDFNSYRYGIETLVVGMPIDLYRLSTYRGNDRHNKAQEETETKMSGNG